MEYDLSRGWCLKDAKGKLLIFKIDLKKLKLLLNMFHEVCYVRIHTMLNFFLTIVPRKKKSINNLGFLLIENGTFYSTFGLTSRKLRDRRIAHVLIPLQLHCLKALQIPIFQSIIPSLFLRV